MGDVGVRQGPQQNKRRNAGTPVVHTIVELRGVLFVNQAVELAARSIRAIKITELHKAHHEYFKHQAKQGGVGQNGEIPLQAQRNQNPQHYHKHGGLSAGQDPGESEVVQDAREGVTDDDCITQTSAGCLQHQGDGHDLRHARPAGSLAALFVSHTSSCMAHTAHQGEGIAEDHAEPGRDDHAAKQARTGGDPRRQAQHALADNVLTDVEHCLWTRGAPDTPDIFDQQTFSQAILGERGGVILSDQAADEGEDEVGQEAEGDDAWRQGQGVLRCKGVRLSRRQCAGSSRWGDRFLPEGVSGRGQ
mmetsp:Transcript_118209/g.341757  ORF Transcript_118209/g.341757 Transcript_118209/m.341757 type:complete len:304 (+) Transcript_118209:326-1237(+)